MYFWGDATISFPSQGFKRAPSYNISLEGTKQIKLSDTNSFQVLLNFINKLCQFTVIKKMLFCNYYPHYSWIKTDNQNIIYFIRWSFWRRRRERKLTRKRFFVVIRQSSPVWRGQPDFAVLPRHHFRTVALAPDQLYSQRSGNKNLPSGSFL